MKKYKFYLMIFILISMLIIPSGSTLANDEIIDPNVGQQENIPDNQTQETIESDPENLEPDSISASINKVFLPLVSRSEATKSILPQIQIPLPQTPSPDYYVSPSGNDSNSGTQSQPWRTIKKATDTLVAGKTVKILPGTYKEKLTPKNSGTANAYIFYTADPGTVILEGSGVTMSTDSRGDGLVQVLGNSYIKVENLTLQNSTANCVNISDNSSGTRPKNIVISNMTIQNCTKVGIRARTSDNLLLKDNKINHITLSSGIGVWWSNTVVVEHNTITNAHYYHECQGAYDEALTISNTKNFEVMYNTIYNTEPNPVGFCTGSEKLGIDVKESSENGRVHHNNVRHMTAGGIYVDGWKAGSNGTPTLNHIDIYNNYVSDGGGIIVGCEQSVGVVEYINIYNNLVVNAWFSGIQVRAGWGDGLRKNITIYNNTIYGASPAGGNGGAGIFVTTNNLGSNNGDAPVIIRNNISMFYLTGWVGQITAATSTIASKISASNNLVSGNMKCSDQYPNCVEVGSRISAPPVNVFINPGDFDLKLKSGSTAIDKGHTIGIMNTDFDGTLRPSGSAYDIGAYEYK
jgi:hypothetical protein